MKKVVLIMSAVLLLAVVLLGMICMRSDKVDIDFAKNPDLHTAPKR